MIVTSKHVNDVGPMQYCGCQLSRSPEGQVRSLTFGDLGSLFGVLHVSRVVFFRADVEFNMHLIIYEVVLVPS